MVQENVRIFSDLDLNFTPHPVTGDLVRRLDDNAIKQALKNLIMTRNFERPFHSEIGSPIREALFNPLTPMTVMIVRRAIIDLVSNFEPRVRLLDVEVISSPENNSLYVSINFRIINTERPLNLEFMLERTR
jgi:phage baseplate assembly protein W